MKCKPMIWLSTVTVHVLCLIPLINAGLSYYRTTHGTPIIKSHSAL